MELSVKVKVDGIPTMKDVADAAARMAAFQSQVLIKCGDITVNAKSLLGLLSLGLKDNMGVTIIARGEDEAQAVCALAALLGA